MAIYLISRPPRFPINGCVCFVIQLKLYKPYGKLYTLQYSEYRLHLTLPKKMPN